MASFKFCPATVVLVPLSQFSANDGHFTFIDLKVTGYQNYVTMQILTMHDSNFRPLSEKTSTRT